MNLIFKEGMRNITYIYLSISKIPRYLFRGGGVLLILPVCHEKGLYQLGDTS